MKIRWHLTLAVVVFAIILAVVLLAGCADASDVTGNTNNFSTTYVDGVRCIVFKPSSSEVSGTQMECDFRGAR